MDDEDLKERPQQHWMEIWREAGLPVYADPLQPLPPDLVGLAKTLSRQLDTLPELEDIAESLDVEEGSKEYLLAEALYGLLQRNLEIELATLALHIVAALRSDKE